MKHISKTLKLYKKNLLKNDKFLNIHIKKLWELILGETVAFYTKKIVLNKNKVYVSLSSSVLKNEISFLKKDIIIKLNEKIGKNLIEEIIIY